MKGSISSPINWAFYENSTTSSNIFASSMHFFGLFRTAFVAHRAHPPWDLATVVSCDSRLKAFGFSGHQIWLWLNGAAAEEGRPEKRLACWLENPHWPWDQPLKWGCHFKAHATQSIKKSSSCCCLGDLHKIKKGLKLAFFLCCWLKRCMRRDWSHKNMVLVLLDGNACPQLD